MIDIGGFGLLIGHLLGDFILQNDWMAKNKTNPHPGRSLYCPTIECSREEHDKWVEDSRIYSDKKHMWAVGNIACTVHCLIYTICIWSYSFWWMPWWGLVVCFLTHWPIDRFRLASKWMCISGQKEFATGALSPWSIIVVDQCFHLITLFFISLLYNHTQ